MSKARNKTIEDYFFKFYFDAKTTLCSLCGNSGIIDTRKTAVSGAGVNAGRLNFCICPNGQAMRDSKADVKAWAELKGVKVFLGDERSN